MVVKIKADTLQALADWKAGKPVRTVQLGHIHRAKENPGMSTTIDVSVHVQNDQDRAYAYCFRILAWYASEEVNVPPDHPAFLITCETIAQHQQFEGLTEEEKIGAQSLAWKALLVGWNKALDGHKDVDYIEVKREE